MSLLAYYNAVAPTYVSGDLANLQTDVNGNLLVSFVNSGSATAANQAAQITLLGGGLPASLDGSGNLKVSFQNPSLAVTGTFWQATQPVSPTANALGSASAGSVTIATSGVPVQLPSSAAANGVVVSAHNGNASLVKGTSGGSVGTANTLTQINGYCLPPGGTIGFAVSNASAIWVNGQVGDVFSWAVS